MRSTIFTLSTALVFASIFPFGTTASAQEPEQAGPVEAMVFPIKAKVSKVTLYQGRAAVTRSAPVNLNQGLFEIQFTGLPESIQPQTLQARILGIESSKVISVDFASQPVSVQPDDVVRELDEKLESLQRSLKDIEDRKGVLKGQDDLLTAIAQRIAATTAENAGAAQFDVEAMRAQLAFTAEERERLVKARRELEIQQVELEKQLRVAQEQRAAAAGSSRNDRVASITVAVPNSGVGTVELTYLVAQATWEPSYNVRAMLETSIATVEYDAILTQRTGEDWDQVQLTLSTAQPTVAANPPVVQPWYVDIFRQEERQVQNRDRVAHSVAPSTPPAPADSAAQGQALGELSADAVVSGGGPSVTFELPRPVTVKSNAAKQQRTRIAAVDANPNLVYVATPALTEAVYVRGELVNDSDYQLLPGAAAIFLGQDYVGPTRMESVPPRGSFKMHFGIDQTVKARRQLVRKNTESTGLLGGGRRTEYDYRITIDNASRKPITLEMWDRHPVSRHEEIQVALRDLSEPLTNDGDYVSQQLPQGLMKWWLQIPAGATGSNAKTITYGVSIDRAKDVEMTELPE